MVNNGALRLVGVRNSFGGKFYGTFSSSLIEPEGWRVVEEE